MLNQEKRLEIDTTEEIETVRCIVENSQEQILLLQKAKESKAPELFEFPGGKMDNIAGNLSTLDEQIQTVIAEMGQETGIDISGCNPQKVDEFSYKFNVGNNVFRRKVHIFLVRLPTSGNDIFINKTVNAEGQPEDKHMQFAWVTKNALLSLKADGRLSGNSQQFEKALGMSL